MSPSPVIKASVRKCVLDTCVLQVWCRRKVRACVFVVERYECECFSSVCSCTHPLWVCAWEKQRLCVNLKYQNEEISWFVCVCSACLHVCIQHLSQVYRCETRLVRSPDKSAPSFTLEQVAFCVPPFWHTQTMLTLHWRKIEHACVAIFGYMCYQTVLEKRCTRGMVSPIIILFQGKLPHCQLTCFSVAST